MGKAQLTESNPIIGPGNEKRITSIDVADPSYNKRVHVLRTLFYDFWHQKTPSKMLGVFL
ncbi:hypothetical protein GCM10011571_00890 [Marinithermofilum abyssi]|uniref:Uncharacterized protein n=1 Tax=Marinithermofilum abyssi TaxID=1571185 RepID=A0A8J2VDX9_9BACL|nr:hypothetical protein GCM10011571_00890 [Marinithermofilum abyssi]